MFLYYTHDFSFVNTVFNFFRMLFIVLFRMILGRNLKKSEEIRIYNTKSADLLEFVKIEQIEGVSKF